MRPERKDAVTSMVVAYAAAGVAIGLLALGVALRLLGVT